MPRRFSRTYPTFESWRTAQPARSNYVIGIEHRHAHYPSASLDQLRRHPRAEQAPLSAVRKAPSYQLPLTQLTQRERLERQRALQILSEARRGEGSLTRLARAERISPRTVRKATGAFRKRADRWVPTRQDRIQRWMKSYEDQRRVEILIDHSRTATLLSEYAHAVNEYLVIHDAQVFRKYQGVAYRDAFRTEHSFETDAAAVLAAVERSESDFGAFADLYAEHEEAEPTA